MQQDHEKTGGIKPDFTFAEHRFYMVGKLIRQDVGPNAVEPGYRETLVCPCHHLPLKVLGPSTYELARYMAYCSDDGEQVARADTMEDLWLVVEQKGETGDPAGVKTVTAAQTET